MARSTTTSNGGGGASASDVEGIGLPPKEREPQEVERVPMPAKLPKGLAAIEEHTLNEWKKGLRMFLPMIAANLQGTGNSASLSPTFKITERKDGNYDVFVSMKPNMQHNGESAKAKWQGGQLSLF